MNKVDRFYALHCFEKPTRADIYLYIVGVIGVVVALVFNNFS